MQEFKLYKKNGEEIDLKKYNKIVGSGKRSTIFENTEDNTVLKIYHSNVPKEQTISEKRFEEIKSINSCAMPKYGDCLYTTNKKKFFPVVRAYTMEKIEKDYTDILTMNHDKFAIEVAGKLSILSDELAKHLLIFSKPKKGNIIVNKKGAIIVDPDLFTRENNLNEYECAMYNKKIALNYLKMLIKECAEYRHNLGDKSEQINELLNFEVLSSTDLTIGVFKNLNGQNILTKLKK